MVHFDDFIERLAEGSENQAEMFVVVEGVDVPYQSLVIVFVAGVDFLENVFLYFGGLDVAVDWSDNLHINKRTLMAYFLFLASAYTTLPKVPSPSMFVIEYTPPSFYPTKKS